MTTATMNTGIQYRYDRRKDFTVSLVVGLLAMIVGACGVWRVVIHGDHGALGSYVPWGVWVSVYVYLVWMEVGMILGYYALKHVLKVEGIERLGPVIVMAVICALLSALMIIGMDLGHPFRAWRAFVFADSGSMMTWMIWLHTFYLTLLMLEFWAYRNDYQELIRWLNWVNIPAGVALIAVIGSLFGVIAARPFWNASMLPMAFLLSSLVAGTALILLLHLLFSPLAGREQYVVTARELGRFLMWAILAGVISAAVNLIVTFYQNVPARAEAMRLLLFGPYWWSMWIVHLLIGTLIPLLQAAFGGNKKRGEWQVAYQYKNLEADATWDAITDSDFGLGGTDRKGHIVKASYNIRDWWQLGFAAFITEKISSRPNTGQNTRGLSGEELLRVQMDSAFKF